MVNDGAGGTGLDETSATDVSSIATFIRWDLIGALCGVAVVLVANGLFVRAAGVWAVLPFLLVLIGALLLADRRLAAGKTAQALALVTFGNWLVALVVPLIVPFLWPIMAITVLMPLVLATPYLARRSLTVALACGAAVAGVTAAIGLINDDGGAVPDIEDELELVVVVGALMGQILPIALIVWQNNDLQRTNLSRATVLNRELQLSEERLAASRRRVVEAADRERRRIERDLHDGAQQRLAALGVRLRLLADEVSDDPPVAGTVADLVQELEGAVDEVRDLARGIYPPLLRSQGLVAALRSVVGRSRQVVAAELGEVQQLDESRETALYFAALEGLANAAKHAPEAEVSVKLAAEAGEMVLTVADDGPGFRPRDAVGTDSGADESSGSQGLANMDDRMAAVGGRFSVESQPGRGTVLTAAVPA